MLASVRKRSQIPRTLNRFYYRRIFRTAAVQGLGRINSEAIKILTPLLPIRPLVEYVIASMRQRHKEEAEEAWTIAERKGIHIAGIANLHDDID
eukprot:30897-Pelagococcus_subviridis.AAC.4